MKNLMLALFAVLSTSSAFATVDGHDRVYLVVQHVQEPTEFFLERAPIIGCYGLARGPHLVQFTAPYRVTSNIGCGGPVAHDNINYLTCAKITSSRENADYSSFEEMTLDISKCEEKNNPLFITMVRTAAKLNFPLAKGEIKLTLVK